MGWRHYGAVEKKRRVADGRGWAGDVDDDVECAQVHGLVFLLRGHGAGGVKHCCAVEVRVECELVSVVATAALLLGR
jgi:hypothetical protein